MPTQIRREPRDIGCCLIFFVLVSASCGALFYAYQKGNPQGFLGIQDSDGQSCGVDIAVKTQPYLYICPDQQDEFSSSATTVCVDICPASGVTSFCAKGYPSKVAASLVCIPYFDSITWQKLEASSFRFMVAISAFANNVSHSWILLLVVNPVLSFGLSLVFLRSMRMSARFVFWPSLATVVFGFVAVAIYSLQKHFSNGSGSDLLYGIVGLSIAVLALFVTFVSRRSIARSFFFLEASGECLTDSLPMMLQPVFECFKKVVLALIFLFGVASLLSCKDRMSTYLLYSMAFFVLLVFVWLAECMGTLSRFVMGYLSQEWFFSTYDSTQNHKLIPTWNIAEAYRTALQYHWGSLCFGAMANMLLKPVRLVLRLIMLLTKSCGISSVKRFYKRIVPFGDSAYLAIAMEGHRYLDACREAAEILGNESVQEITWLDDILIEVQILGSFAISFWVTCGVWICMATLPSFNDPYSSSYLDDKEIVLATAFLASQLCIWPLMECIGQVADALLFSYRAGSGGYLGIAAMVSERTGLFQMDCVGGPGAFTPFTHHPPKLTQMLVFLNEGQA